MKIFIASDHRGFELKSQLIQYLKKKNYNIFDIGNSVYDPSDDYPDIGKRLGKKVAADVRSRGIAICGSGAGICMAANKIRGARAVLSIDTKIARAARNDDDANVLCLPADFISFAKAQKIVEVWLRTNFKKEKRFIRRVQKLNRI